MRRYLLYYTEGRDAPPDDVRRIEAAPGMSVVAATQDMVVVETNRACLNRLIGELNGWHVHAGAGIKLPVETGLTRAAQAGARG